MCSQRWGPRNEQLDDHESNPDEFTNIADVKIRLGKWLPTTNAKPVKRD